MKAIDKLREEAQARGRGLEKNFSSPLPFSSSFLTHQPLPLEFFFTCANTLTLTLTLSVSASKLFAPQNTGALRAKKVQGFHFIFCLIS